MDVCDGDLNFYYSFISLINLPSIGYLTPSKVFYCTKSAGLESDIGILLSLNSYVTACF